MRRLELAFTTLLMLGHRKSKPLLAGGHSTTTGDETDELRFF